MGRFRFAALAALAAVGLASVASAADMSTKAPMYTKAPPAEPAWSWTGFYVGVNLGGDSEHASFTSNEIGGGHIGFDPAEPAAGTGTATKGGVAGGAQIGANWQTGSLVLGAEADIDLLSGKPSLQPGPLAFTNGAPGTFTLATNARADWMSTVRARAGIAVDHTLIYVTGGAAFADIKVSQSYSDNCCTTTPLTTASTTTVKTGYSVGGGLEYAINNHWSVRGEYLYAGGFGNVGVAYFATALSGNSDFHSGTANLTIQVARAAVNYKF